MFRYRSALRFAALLLAIACVGCTVPFIGGGEEPAPTAEPTAEPATQAPAATLAPPTEAPQPTAEPLGPPIPHLTAGQLINVSFIRMVTDSLGWAIGGVAGAADHILRTRDGGTNWADITPPEPAPVQGEPQKAAVGYFSNGDEAWVLFYPSGSGSAAGRFRVWATQDGGDSWTASQPFELEFLGFDDYPPMLGFSDSLNGWLLARDGPSGMHRYSVYLLRTSDGGQHWSVLIDPFESVGLQSCHKNGLTFADAQIGWATVDNCPVPAPELQVSSDGGQTWESQPLPAPSSRPGLFEDEICEAHSAQMLSQSEGAVGVSCRTGAKLNYFYSTEDGGQTWESRLYPGGAIRLLSRRTAFALERKLYQTADGGANWTWVKTVQWDGQFSFVSETLIFAVARSDGAIALVRSSNGGLTWDLLKPIIGP